MRVLSVALAVGLWVAPAANCRASAKAPYPPSPVITAVAFDFASRDRRAPGSDNWPITWADDDHQYAAWGDGGGFGSTSFWNFPDKRLSPDGMRFTMIFTGTGYNDAWNTVRGTFSVATTSSTAKHSGVRSTPRPTQAVRPIAATASPVQSRYQRIPTVQRWVMFELALTNSRTYANPFTQVTLEATFTSPSGRQVKGLGFYDGGTTWRLRFMPDEIGQWRYEARFSDGSPGASGSFRCVPGKTHGPLRVRRDNPLWFEYADGTPFYLRAFHLWWLDALDPDTLYKTLDFLKAQGFNAVVGPHLVPPNRLPWERKDGGRIDFSRFNLDFWRNMDRALMMLADRGMVLVPFSIFGGTNGMPKIPTWEETDLFLRYWTARWSGFWNATFQPTSEWEEGFSEAEILRIGSRLHELDGGRHLVSVHALKASSEAVQKARWFAYHTVQDKLTERNPTKYTWFVDLHRRVRKPILAHECLWEGNFYQEEAGMDVDNLRKAAWVIALCGGQINYADEVVPPRRWQRRGDEGKTFSERGKAMEPQGQFYQHLKILGDFMQSLRFWRMVPRPELSSTGVCLAEPGREYVVYVPDGKLVSLDLTSARAPLSGRWLNPRDGRFGKGFRARGGARHSFAPPDGSDWVLHLKA